MIAISLGGLLGAIVGIVIAALVHGPIAGYVERRMRARVREADGREQLSQEIALMRHGIITFDLLVFCGAGYWLGDRIAG
jgi:hypothetical protein